MKNNNKISPKFPRGSKIAVCKELPSNMSHFLSGFKAIVEYTYAEKYGGSDIDRYSLIVLNDNDEPINTIAWYYEDQLTLISNDVANGKEIIEKYMFG